RDFHVTGVQTCALPIFPPPFGTCGLRCFLAAAATGRTTGVEQVGDLSWRLYARGSPNGGWCISIQSPCTGREVLDPAYRPRSLRSEERRVGREGRTGGW